MMNVLCVGHAWMNVQLARFRLQKTVVNMLSIKIFAYVAAPVLINARQVQLKKPMNKLVRVQDLFSGFELTGDKYVRFG